MSASRSRLGLGWLNVTALVVLLAGTVILSLVGGPGRLVIAQDATDQAVETDSILFVGNSFTSAGGGVGNFVAALAASILVNRLRLPGPVLGNEDIIFWFVSQRMFPPIITAFALFLMYSEMGRAGLRLIDTYWGLTLCYVAFVLPIVIWLLRDFFAALPVEIEEAAMVDNVPMWRIFVQIVLPMAAPGLAATFMIALSFVWNEFLFALFLTTSKWQTLPILVAGQNSQRGDEWWAISAAVLIAIVPMMIMAILLSRLMRSGLLLGAIK